MFHASARPTRTDRRCEPIGDEFSRRFCVGRNIPTRSFAGDGPRKFPPRAGRQRCSPKKRLRGGFKRLRPDLSPAREPMRLISMPPGLNWVWSVRTSFGRTIDRAFSASEKALQSDLGN